MRERATAELIKQNFYSTTVRHSLLAPEVWEGARAPHMKQTPVPLCSRPPQGPLLETLQVCRVAGSLSLRAACRGPLSRGSGVLVLPTPQPSPRNGAADGHLPGGKQAAVVQSP